MSYINVNFDDTEFKRSCKNILENFTTCAHNLNCFEEKKTDRQRCKYCGCLVSNFDIHCSSCGAPI